ncbi:hypothetical protein CLOM_g4361 [Closterium sp. NIES-68]|nr:hypothetical protein CLOM_g4361 [Closterium sp. NIES-68]
MNQVADRSRILIPCRRLIYFGSLFNLRLTSIRSKDGRVIVRPILNEEGERFLDFPRVRNRQATRAL